MYYKEKKSHTGRNIFIILIILALAGGLFYFKPDFISDIKDKIESKLNRSEEIKTTETISEKKGISKYEKEYLNQVFAKVPTRNEDTIELKLDIYRPENLDGATPVVLYIPGKLWLLEKENLNSNPIFQKIKELNNSGITVAVPEYRDAVEGIFPAQIFDVKAALRHLKGNSENYGIDKNKIVAVGEDSGATLALLLSTTADRNEFKGDVGTFPNEDTKIAAVAVFSPVTDIMNVGEDMSSRLMNRNAIDQKFDSYTSITSKLIGFDTDPKQGMKTIRKLRKERAIRSTDWNKVQLTEMASPLYYVSNTTTPTLIIHGVENTDSPLRQSLKYVEHLMKNDVENIYISNSKGASGYQGDELAEMVNLWIRNRLK